MIKYKIRKFSISFSKRKARMGRSVKENLLIQLQMLEKEEEHNDQNSD